MKLFRNGTRERGPSGAGTARLTAALALTGLLFAALAAFGAARYASSAAAQAIPPGGPGAAQYEYRPGWGCGDRNHIHTGPPGNQDATRPPGCAKAQAKANAAKAKCTSKASKAKAKANAKAKSAKATKRMCAKAKAAKAKRRG